MSPSVPLLVSLNLPPTFHFLSHCFSHSVHRFSQVFFHCSGSSSSASSSPWNGVSSGQSEGLVSASPLGWVFLTLFSPSTPSRTHACRIAVSLNRRPNSSSRSYEPSIDHLPALYFATTWMPALALVNAVTSPTSAPDAPIAISSNGSPSSPLSFASAVRFAVA